MDKQRVEGAMDKAKGSAKKAAGQMTGDEKLKAEGEIDKMKGKAKSVAGGMRDTAREMDEKDRRH
jgi:uncharacterized protein YjbJ (UPF0337 family)